MQNPVPVPNRPIYHITHIRNLPGILERGGLFSDNATALNNLTDTEIGMPSIKQRRRTTIINCGPGGTPADYVPFYFGYRSPMLYSIHRGNVPTYREGQEPVIYLTSSLAAVRNAGLPAVFSEGNAGATFVDFHADNPELCEKLIDWPLMKADWWHDIADDPNRASRRQAEYLVHKSFPVQLIASIVTKNEHRATEVRNILAEYSASISTVVYPQWYY
ncbi:type II toxin-antitoxin system toxin DNA ADP-ribosyl transferase DarT [Streptomyces nodosus]|uniref:type II toxin-antitoxin system toxin DNA ADP-ribosyl transferase DarT n=1 Tax=Streptomyces nodosus TaxID=40318 RepID=UPI0037FC9612